MSEIENMDAGINNKGIFKKRLLVSCIAFILIAGVIIVGVVLVKGKEDNKKIIDTMAAGVFYNLNGTFQKSEYCEIHSVDGYCIENKNKPYSNCFINVKYRAYLDFEDKWYEIDEVYYGKEGHVEGFYCLNWDSIEGFETEHEEFERAVKDGYHKEFTSEEIRQLREKNKPEE